MWTQSLSKHLTVLCMQHRDVGQRGDARPWWGAERDNDRSHNSEWHTMKTYVSFTYGIFHLMFADCSCLQVTETTEHELADEGGPPRFHVS